jgi:hypothetical protein
VAEAPHFYVSRKDVHLLLAEIADQPQAVLYTPLLQALLAAETALEITRTGDGRDTETTELPLVYTYALHFRRWLQDAALRARVAGLEERARALDRIRGPGQ